MENKSVIMTEQKRIWHVDQGSAEVFVVRKINGNPIGSRRFLLQVNAGQLIFEISPSDMDVQYGILITGNAAVRLVEPRQIEPDKYVGMAYLWVLALAQAVGIDGKNTGADKTTVSDGAWMERFHREMLQRFIKALEKRKLEEKKRLQESRRYNHLNMGRSLLTLASVTNKKAEASLDTGNVENPLFAACQLIGKAARINMIYPAYLKAGKQTANLLGEICRASRIRYRAVALKGEWWKDDNGSMLGYLEEGEHPVALISETPTRYRMYNTADGSSCIVDQEVAARIKPLAVYFYRPFPKKKLGVKEILIFGIEGCWKQDLAMIVLMSLAGSLMSMFTPVVTGIIFDSVIPEGERGLLVQIAFLMGAIAICTMFMNITRSMATQRMEGRMDGSVQSAVWDRLISLPAPFFKQFTAGELSMRAMGISTIRSMLSGIAVNSILSSVFSLMFLVQMFYYSTKLALVACLFFTIGIAFTVVLNNLQLRAQSKQIDAQNRISGLLFQLLNGVSKFKAAGAEVRAFSKWSKAFAASRKVSYSRQLYTGVINCFNSVFTLITTMGIYYALMKFTGTTLAAGKFIAFNAALGMFMGNILSLSNILVKINLIVPLYKMAKPILETLPEYDETKADPGELDGDIEVSHITFRYKADSPTVLQDVSFKIKAGEYVAIVGPSGSGKSTLLRVLLGFEKSSAGQVYYNGKAMQNVDIRCIRKQLGVVLQNGQLMSGDIYTNIVGSNINLTINDAWDAAIMAGLDVDIKEMPMGMNTLVSEGGGTLSGGQRQRLMIARAIVNKPRILYFDEATSALDNKTQNIVSKSLDKLKVTRVVIAHRLSTIINCDRIIVLDKGMIVEQGSYNELMKKDGVFAQLAKRQLA